jgi:cellulose synthase/poly-beta-1,6-N-acetylglucosamine synthase-like glycosyltransferase
MQADGDWLLFTDADVLFKPDSLRRALAYAEAQQRGSCRALPADDHEDVRAST